MAVIGGGMVGCETAEYLAARGCKVSVIEMMDKIAAGESTTILPTLLENYKPTVWSSTPATRSRNSAWMPLSARTRTAQR